MKKKFSFVLALALVLTMCASVMVSFAAEPIVYDFTQEGIACVGDAVSGNAKFFGKSKRFEYQYVNGVSKLIYTDGDGQHNPYITNSNVNADASTYKYVKIAYWSKAGGESLSIFYDNGSGITAENSVSQAAVNDGTWQYAIFDMSGVASWTGTIKQLRYDFLVGGAFNKDDYVYCGYIGLFDSADAAQNYTKDLPEMEATVSTDPSISLDKTTYELTDDFSITLTFKNVPNKDTWFGIYPATVGDTITDKDTIDVWTYTNGSKTEIPAEVMKDGTLVLTKEICGDFSKLTKGDYKIVMFKGGSAEDTYTILDTKTFTFADKAAEPTKTPTPKPNPGTSDANTIFAVAAVAMVLGASMICFKKKTQA